MGGGKTSRGSEGVIKCWFTKSKREK